MNSYDDISYWYPRLRPEASGRPHPPRLPQQICLRVLPHVNMALTASSWSGRNASADRIQGVAASSPSGSTVPKNEKLSNYLWFLKLPEGVPVH